VQVPSDTGEYLMNNKRDNIARIEENYEVQITLQIRPDLDIPHYRIERQWTENNQQRVEVLEDTSKNKKPPRSGRKLKPVKPVVGIPTPAPEKEAPKKESRLKAILDLITGQKRREKLKLEAEEAEKQRTKEEAQKRRQRGGRNRKRPASASTAGNAEKADSNNKKKKKQQNKPKAQQQPKTQEETGAEKANGNKEAGATENKNRRRRRRRKRPSGDDNSANQKTATEQKKPQSEPVATAPTEG
jgi:ribonuclease E